MCACLEMSTVFVRELFHHLAPSRYPEPEYSLGRPLSVAEDDPPVSDTVTSSGNLIVHINQIIRDPHGNEYRVVDMIGSGTFSRVYKCLQPDGSLVALKISKNIPQFRDAAVNEAAVLTEICARVDASSRQDLVIPERAFEIDGHICLALPILQRSLFNGIAQDRSLGELLSSIRTIMTCILRGLKAIHDCGIIHGDIKPENILTVTDDLPDVVQIADFGSASLTGRVGGYIQSRFYRSPEVVLGLPYDTQIDMWSVGCIAVELFLDFAVFACESEMDLVSSMTAIIGDLPSEMLFASQKWMNFYDLSTQGTFTLKLAPADAMVRHLNHQMFVEAGACQLSSLILGHMPPDNTQDVMELMAFHHFVHRLLTYDPKRRMTAAEALEHPFVTNVMPVNPQASFEMGQDVSAGADVPPIEFGTHHIHVGLELENGMLSVVA